MTSHLKVISREVWLIVACCAAINLGIFLYIGMHHPEYLTDSGRLNNPDARQYFTLGKNFWEKGVYSRQSEPPYQSDLLRTPVFPLLAGGLDILAGPWAVYLCNVLAHLGTCVAVFSLGERLFDKRVGLLASGFIAADLMLAVNNFQGMSEATFMFLLAVSLVLIIPEILNSNDKTQAMTPLLIGGLVLGLATLTRPTSLYLAGLFIIIPWIRATLTKQVKAGQASLIIFASFGLLVGPWIARNYLVHGLPRLTNIDRINFVYFVGAGAYQVRHGIDLETAQNRIATEFNLPEYSTVQNPWTSHGHPLEFDKKLGDALPNVVGKYPESLAISSICAILKSSISHNAAELAYYGNTEWIPPGFGGLISLDKSAMQKLFSNDPFLVVAFAGQMGHTIVALLLAVVGIIGSFVVFSDRAGVVTLLAVLVYLYLTIAVFGFEAFWRCRIPAMPVLYIFSAIGAVTLFSICKNRRRRNSGRSVLA